MHPARRLRRTRPLTAAEHEANHQRDLAFFNPVTPSRRAVEMGMADRVDRLKQMIKEARDTLARQDVYLPELSQPKSAWEIAVQCVQERTQARAVPARPQVQIELQKAA